MITATDKAEAEAYVRQIHERLLHCYESSAANWRRLETEAFDFEFRAFARMRATEYEVLAQREKAEMEAR
jgi:hypothetical protein